MGGGKRKGRVCGNVRNALSILNHTAFSMFTCSTCDKYI